MTATIVPPVPTHPLSIADLTTYKHAPAVDPTYPANMLTFYAPYDNVHGALKALIASTTKSLVIAMYAFADDELAQMVADLIDNPNIYVQVTLDSSQSLGTHEAAILVKLAKEMKSNSVAIGTSEKGAIMHRKMVIVDGLWRVSGSTNWSTSGETKQDNEMTVIQSAAVCAEARHILDLEHRHAQTKAASKTVTLPSLDEENVEVA